MSCLLDGKSKDTKGSDNESEKSCPRENDDTPTSSPSPPLTKAIPVSPSPPPSTQAASLSPITIPELNSSPYNHRIKSELVLPISKTHNDDRAVMVGSTLSLRLQGQIVTGSLRYSSMIHLAAKSERSGASGQNKATMVSSSSPTLSSSSSSPATKSTGRLKKKKRNWYMKRKMRPKFKKKKKKAKPGKIKQLAKPPTSSDGDSPKDKGLSDGKYEINGTISLYFLTEEGHNERIVGTEGQPFEESDATINNEAVPINREEDSDGCHAPQIELQTFSYDEEEEEGFLNINVPSIVSVEVNEVDDDWLDLSVMKSNTKKLRLSIQD